MKKKLILFLFFPKQRAAVTVSPAFMPSSPMLQSFYYVEECFSLKQSRQKNLSQSEQKVFILFVAIALASLESCFLIFS
jgi:hypothetical protein